jgi:hypothetical protein
MKILLHPHPDLAEKSLLVFNISIFIMLLVVCGLYYNMVDDGVEHQQAINVSIMIGLFVGVTIGSVIYAKYIRKHKEDKVVDENIKKK